jgi:hypothetical protein
MELLFPLSSKRLAGGWAKSVCKIQMLKSLEVKSAS